MSLFYRATRLVLIIVATLCAGVVAVAFYFAKQVIAPRRLPLWAKPDDVGMAYEDVQFPARGDGTRLSGWFIPAPAGRGNGATLVMVHGWPWNRLGQVAEGISANLMGTMAVDLLRLAHALHAAGFNLLMYDARNHGESAAVGPVTFGYEESRDLLGAVDYLQSRSDVRPEKIGAIGFSMGGNTVLYSLPHTEAIQAAVVIQPTSIGQFAPRFAHNLLGVLGYAVVPLAEWLIELKGGLPFRAIDPVYVAPSAGKTPILYIQGQGDPWGSAENVAQMAQATPNVVQTIFVDSHNRYEGYIHVVNHPELLTSFFADFLVKKERPVRK